MEPENKQSSHSKPNQEEKLEEKLEENYDYEFFTVNNEPNSLVMLKKIDDLIPLFITVVKNSEEFILLNCSPEIEEMMNQKDL